MSSDLPINDALQRERDRSVTERPVRLKVLGIGGAGANAVDRLTQDCPPGVSLAAVNTDSQALAASLLEEKVLLGWGITRGLGAGSDPELGRLAAESDRERIERIITGTDLLILVAGMGGGTGSGAAPVIAEMASKQGILTLAFVTTPFTFEGGRRKEQAEAALEALRKVCDAVIPLNNDLLLQVEDEGSSVLKAFAEADAWIGRGIRAVASIACQTGLINLDFSSMRQVFLHRGGKALFGFGTGRGPEPVTDAISELKRCPLRHTPDFARKADRMLVNITGGPDLSLSQINEIMLAVSETFGRDPHVAMGAVIDENLAGVVDIVVLGVTDPGVRGRLPRGSRPPTPQVQRRPAATDAAIPVAEAAGSTVPVAADPQETAQAQEELPLTDIETRGLFEKTERNLWEGQDLDTPTYLRRGIRIQLT
jgi:cell division protein FtsZ